MIEKMIYIFLIIGLIGLYIYIERQLKEKYYKKNNLPPAGRLFIAGIIYPKPFFKKRNFWRGYFLHILHIILIFGACYFFIKLIGVL